MPLRCDTIFENGEKGGIEPWSIASKKPDDMQFTICATGGDVSVDSAVLLLVLPVHLD